MISVAFFRNLNLGHAGSPSGKELVDAFGGEDIARNFQTNGTVIFYSAEPFRLVRAAQKKLKAYGFSHDVMHRSLAEILAAVECAPRLDPDEDIYRQMISLFDGAEFPPEIPLPHRTPNGLVEIRAVEEGLVHSVCWKSKNTAGNVTAYLEKLLAVPVTTRTLGTMQRLIKAASPNET